MGTISLKAVGVQPPHGREAAERHLPSMSLKCEKDLQRSKPSQSRPFFKLPVTLIGSYWHIEVILLNYWLKSRVWGDFISQESRTSKNPFASLSPLRRRFALRRCTKCVWFSPQTPQWCQQNRTPACQSGRTGGHFRLRSGEASLGRLRKFWCGRV